MRKHLRPLLAAPALALLLQGTAVAAPELAITSPEDGATISRGAQPSIEIGGQVQFEEPEALTRRWFVRRDACGGEAAQNERLSIVQGVDGGSGCGYIPPGWAALSEVFAALGEEGAFAAVHPAEDGIPFTLDASEPITGTVVISSYRGLAENPFGVAAGMATVTVEMLADTPTGQVSLGSDSEEYTVLPTEPEHTFNFSFDSPAAQDKKDFLGLSMKIDVRGPAAIHGYLQMSGASFVDVPIWTASFDRKVETGVDNGPFSSTGVTLSEDFTSFSRIITTPLPGTRTIKARARQGTQVSATDTVTITVTP
jgi:hypothetical protein